MSPKEENYTLVEGEFGEFIFSRVKPKDVDEVIEHINTNFLVDEPTCKLLGPDSEFIREFEPIAKRMMEDEMSFIARHKESGEIAALRVTFRHKKDFNLDGLTINTYPMKVLLLMVKLTEQKANLFEKYGIEEYADFFVASTAQKYRRRGLANEMYRRSLKFLKAEGFKVAKSVFTSPYTRKAALNLQFEELSRVNYTDMKLDDGEKIFNEEDLTPEHYGALMVKVL